MKFNSQICTTKEQSERLLSVGLDKETADMAIISHPRKDIEWKLPITEVSATTKYIPAWSLHRLIEMLNYQVIHNDKKYEPVIAIDGMAYQNVCNDDAVVGWHGDLYTDVLDCVEWLIKEGYFNKEYLEE
jgi:hypothetical protein